MPHDTAVVFRGVGFRFDSALAPLFAHLSVHFPPGFTGIVGANGAGKTTLLRLATGELAPDQGVVQSPARAVYCAQRTDEPPEALPALLAATDAEAHALRGRLGIEPSFGERWGSLSHGERKRAQIAGALWRDPALLAIDEPTNHLDLPSIECLQAALADCPCGLLLVSHDERLLSALAHTRWEIREGALEIRVAAGASDRRRDRT